MKNSFTKIAIYVASLAFAIGSISASEKLVLDIPEGSLTIEEAFQIALQNNPSIDEVEERILGAEATVKRAKSYMLPSIDVTSGYSSRNTTSQPDWNTAVRGSHDFNDFGAGVSLRWRLFDGLQDIHYIRAAKKGLESAKYLHKDAQRILVEQVSAAFIQSEMAKEQMRIAKSDYEFNRKLEADARVQFEVGQIPEEDVLNFSLALVSAESDFLNARKDFEKACSIIALLLAVDDAQLSANKYPKVDSLENEVSIPAYQACFSKAMAQRPDVQASIATVALYEHQVDAVEGSFLPKLDLISGFNYSKTNDMGEIDQDEHDSYVGLSASWNIYSGGRKKAELREMVADKNVQVQAYEQLVDSLAAEIREDLINLNNANYVMLRQKQAESYALKIRNFVEKAYNQGELSITRLNEAQTNWIKAASGLSISRLQVLLHSYELESTTGDILQRF